MRHSARSKFVEDVLESFATFADYYAKREVGLRRDTRNAAAVAEALRDLPEHIFHDPAHRSSIAAAHGTYSAYRKDVRGRSNGYDILCDVADVWKHRKLGRKKPQVPTLEAIKECVAIVRLQDSMGFYYDARKLLVVRTSDGKEHAIEQLLTAAVNAWLVELVRVGVISNPPPLRGLFHPLPGRSKASSEIAYIGQAGEFFELQHVALVHEKSTNLIRSARKGDEFRGQVHATMTIRPSPFKGP